MPFQNFFRAVAYAAPALSKITQDNASALLNNTAKVISNTSASIVHNTTKMMLDYFNGNSTFSSDENNDSSTNDKVIGVIGIVVIFACVCCAVKYCRNSEAEDVCCARRRVYVV